MVIIMVAIVNMFLITPGRCFSAMAMAMPTTMVFNLSNSIGVRDRYL